MFDVIPCSVSHSFIITQNNVEGSQFPHCIINRKCLIPNIPHF
uniref:Uncharacterized protein n=1 Tax=Anguilla anguilla TaxID=7936 RepID=A0A0E9RA73_ANGAN